jgi:hypothetical protein
MLLKLLKNVQSNAREDLALLICHTSLDLGKYFSKYFPNNVSALLICSSLTLDWSGFANV